MKLYPIKSNMIEAIGYDDANYILQVVMTSGKTFEYDEVPPEVWQDLFNAESVGSYFMNHILDAYPETEI